MRQNAQVSDLSVQAERVGIILHRHSAANDVSAVCFRHPAAIHDNERTHCKAAGYIAPNKDHLSHQSQLEAVAVTA